MVDKKKKKRVLWFESDLDDFRKMQRQMRENMRDMWSPFFRMPEISFPKTQRFIKVRIGETDQDVFIRAEVPGFSKDEIKLKVTPENVFISAEKKKEKIDKKEDSLKSFQSFSSAQRTISLPSEVKIDKTRAKLRDGILEIMLPKKHVKKTEEKEVKID